MTKQSTPDEEWDMDREDAWTPQITNAHPTNTGDHKTYQTAMIMVGNRHSKAALVDLVNWLLKGKPYGIQHDNN